MILKHLPIAVFPLDCLPLNTKLSSRLRTHQICIHQIDVPGKTNNLVQIH